MPRASARVRARTHTHTQSEVTCHVFSQEGGKKLGKIFSCWSLHFCSVARSLYEAVLTVSSFSGLSFFLEALRKTRTLITGPGALTSSGCSSLFVKVLHDADFLSLCLVSYSDSACRSLSDCFVSYIGSACRSLSDYFVSYSGSSCRSLSLYTRNLLVLYGGSVSLASRTHLTLIVAPYLFPCSLVWEPCNRTSSYFPCTSSRYIVLTAIIQQWCKCYNLYRMFPRHTAQQS
jgi:hypothetical protein